MNLELREQVRSHYAAAATSGSGCCSSKEQTGVLSLGSGDPLPAADLRAGERVLDLGSGAGPDVIRAAQQVGNGLIEIERTLAGPKTLKQRLEALIE